MGNVIDTTGVRRGMGSPVSTMNVTTTDTMSSAHSSNITTPSAGEQVTNSVLKDYTLSHVIYLNLWLFHHWENSVGNMSQKLANILPTGFSYLNYVVASVCHWDDHAKLVNLTLRLRG